MANKSAHGITLWAVPRFRRPDLNEQPTPPRRPAVWVLPEIEPQPTTDTAEPRATDLCH